MANWANIFNMGDPRTPGWTDKSLVTVQGPGGQSWVVNRAAAPAFAGFFGDLLAAGYQPSSSGGFNYRNIRGSDSKLSQHAFGTAVDVDAAHNPLGTHTTNLPANVGDIAKKWNLEWGGNWKGRPDPMHFEWQGDRPSSVPGGPAMLTGAQTPYTIGPATGIGIPGGPSMLTGSTTGAPGQPTAPGQQPYGAPVTAPRVPVLPADPTGGATFTQAGATPAAPQQDASTLAALFSPPGATTTGVDIGQGARQLAGSLNNTAGTDTLSQLFGNLRQNNLLAQQKAQAMMPQYVEPGQTPQVTMSQTLPGRQIIG